MSRTSESAFAKAVREHIESSSHDFETDKAELLKQLEYAARASRRRAVSQPDVDKKAIAQKLAKITPQDNDRKILSNALTHAPERIYQLLVAAVTSNNQQWASQSEEVDSLLDENVTLKMLDGTIRGPGKNDVRAALNDTVKLLFERMRAMQVPQNQLARSAKVSKEGPRITRSGTVEIYIHMSILIFNYNLREEYSVDHRSGKVTYIARSRV